jgi:type I restriction enzyme S subunit
MKASSDWSTNGHTRIYDRANSIVFKKTKEAFGGLSNMAGGFPLCVNGIRILTSEALYQACRFPHLPEVQKLIIAQKSPMTAKMKGKPHRASSRSDWDLVRVKIMRWCLRVKLAQNWAAFSRLLLDTGDRPIVEESRRDAFWGAKPVDEQTLVGMNVLGRLLMELREEVLTRDPHLLLRVEPLAIFHFRLYGQEIQPVEADDVEDFSEGKPRLESTKPFFAPPAEPVQVSLFDQLPQNAETVLRPEGVEQAHGSVADLKPYPHMKKSGVPWLGEVPKHWQVLPNRALFDEIKKRDCPEEQMLSVTIRKGVVRQADLLEDSSKKDSSNLDRSKYKLVEPGDIAYNKMRAWQGAIGASGYRGIISPAYVVQQPRPGGDSRYFHYLFRTPSFAKEAERWSYGITSDMWSLRPEHFKMIYACLPSPPEQASIVRFLDHMDRRVRRYVRAKRKMIGLLEEQKQSIIHRAVTRGLDLDVPLKPSGVEWLGNVREDSNILPLKRLILRGSSISYGIVQPGPHVADGVPFLQTTNISKSQLVSDGLQRTTPEIAAAYPRSRLTGGEVILGIRASIGSAHVVPDELEGANLSRGIARIVPGSQLTAEYLVLYLRSHATSEYWEVAKQGTTFSEVSIETVRSLPVVVPPSEVQIRVVDEAKRLCQPFKIATSKAEREIELLREYRTRLIADVVTGKLDVREAAAKLPEEPDELEPPEEAGEFIDDGEDLTDELEAASMEALSADG